MDLKKLSVKNFIGDLPRIINESLDAIEKAFNDNYNEETNTFENQKNPFNVKCKKLEAADEVVSNGNIYFYADNKKISILELYNKVKQLEHDINKEEDNIIPKLAKKKLQ